MSSRSLIAVALIAVVLGGTGCSSKSDNPSGSSNQATLPECPSVATMKSELGIAYVEPIASNGGKGKNRSCTYAFADGTPGYAVVHFELLNAAAEFGAIKTGYGVGGRTTADVSGLGDQAFSSVLSAGGIDNNTVAARKGLLHILVTSHASIAQEKAFIAKLFG